MKNLKSLKEIRNEKVAKMERLSDRYKSRDFPSDVQAEWDSLKYSLNGINQEIEKAKNAESEKIGNAVRAHNQANKYTADLYSKDQRFLAEAMTNGTIDAGDYFQGVMDKPKNEAQAKEINASVTSSGFELPKRVAREVVDKLRQANPLIQLGAYSLEIEGKTNFVKVATDPTAVWHQELNKESVNSGTFGKVEMDPKTVLANTAVSREVLQDSENAGDALTTAFVGSISEAIHEASFTGSGANTPSGIASEVTQTEEFTNGGSGSYTELVKAKATLLGNKVNEDSIGVIYSPTAYEAIGLEQDSNNRFQNVPQVLKGLPYQVSAEVPAGEMVIGDFSKILYGFALDINIEQFKSAQALEYGSLWVAAARLDLSILNSKAFVRIIEASA